MIDNADCVAIGDQENLWLRHGLYMNESIVYMLMHRTIISEDFVLPEAEDPTVIAIKKKQEKDQTKRNKKHS